MTPNENLARVKSMMRIKDNVQKMVSQGAPAEDIDAYIASEGVSVEQVRAFGQRGHDVPEFDPGVEGYNPETGMVEGRTGGMSDKVGAFTSGAVDLPIVGPTLKKGATALAAGMVSPFTEKSFGDVYGEMTDRSNQVVRENPGTALAGQMAGSMAVMAPLAATGPGAFAFGLKGGNLMGRAAMSALSTGGISAADTAARGGDMEDIAGSAAIGAGIGGAIPLAGAAGRAAYRAARDKVTGLVRGATKPSAEAAGRVSAALRMDRANSAGVLGPDDLAAAQRNAQPLMNADRGGEMTRALARAAANQSPEARGMMERATSDRFASQGGRVQRLISRLTGGRTDDLALQEELKSAATKANAAAYRRAYTQGATVRMTPEMERLTGSPAVVTAMRNVANGSGRDRAIAEGMGSFNPGVRVTEDGRILFTKTKSGGAPAYPDLQFWDYTKREIDAMANKAARSGDNDGARYLGDLARALRGELDDQVPAYRIAREGAAAFFGAENAIDAGKAFARSNRMLPEYKRGIAAMKPAEKKAFEVGFASELIDKAKNVKDRSNVIRNMFQSPEAREKMVMAFGKPKAREIEAFVRVEVAMDALRGAFGNSTTARQLIESGVIGGGTWWYTGDFNKGVFAAAAAQGAQMAGNKISDNVMKEVAKMLLSDDPKLIQKAVQNAAMSPKHMAAIDALTKAVGIGARAGGLAAISNQAQ